MRWVAVLGLAAALLPVSAGAESPNVNYDVRMLSFDMWCLEAAHYSPDRCDARAPDDVAEFEIYRAAVERYELPYLKRRQAERQQNERISHDVQPRAVTRPNIQGR
jgi:hypothetical protein